MPISSPPITFLHLCNRLQEIKTRNESREKITSLSEFLSEVSEPQDLQTAIQFIGEGAFPAHSGKRISAGSRTLGLAASSFCDIDYDLVFKPCRSATGSNTETIVRLIENIPAARTKTESANLSLAGVQSLYTDLNQIRNRQEKTERLHAAWACMTPLEISYFLRILRGQVPSSGLTIQDILSAITSAFRSDPDHVRRAHVLTHSLGETALLAKENRLESAEFRLFQPVPYMHARQGEQLLSEDGTDYTVEEKIDGIRAQIHVRGQNIAIFDRSLQDITPLFPDLTDLLKSRNLPAAVFDGVICLFKNNRIQPHQLIHKRMQSKKQTGKILSEYPVIYIPFDLLYANQKLLLDETLTHRRQLLGQICETYNLPVTLQFDAGTPDDLTLLFNQAVKHGSEGLIVKNKKSGYKYGERPDSWIKIKKPEQTLDTVVMYAHAESRNPGRLYSEFTLGISVEEDTRYEESFIPIGKIENGYAGDDLKNINKQIRNLTAERYGPVLGLKPGIIIRTAFKAIRKNRRTKAGYTLQSPRFVEFMQDSDPSAIHSLSDVEELYHQETSASTSPKRETPTFILRKLPSDL